MLKEKFSTLIAEIDRLAENAENIASMQQAIADKVAGAVDTYNWVGFYMVDPEDASILVLGPYHGEPTQHVRIPVTQGICGAAVACDETVLVKDVTR